MTNKSDKTDKKKIQKQTLNTKIKVKFLCNLSSWWISYLKWSESKIDKEEYKYIKKYVLLLK